LDRFAHVERDGHVPLPDRAVPSPSVLEDQLDARDSVVELGRDEVADDVRRVRGVEPGIRQLFGYFRTSVGVRSRRGVMSPRNARGIVTGPRGNLRTIRRMLLGRR
jgi:hypothetical protein